MNRRWNKEKFIEAAKEVHGGLYDYSLLEWETIKSKVKIICPEHGLFEQIADKHYRGQGCLHCRGKNISLSKRKPLTKFVEDAKKVHGNKYSYEDVEYLNNSTLVKITCKFHGEFQQSPSAHLMWQGCPACNSTGFISNKPANFYIATNGFLTKVGITNKHPTLRLKFVSNSAKSEFELIEYFNFENGRQALSLETQMLKILRENFEQCNTYFDGSKECFYDVPYQFIQQNVGKFLLTI